jgi:hypothetical protein
MRIVNVNAFINNTPIATSENANFPVENLQNTALSTVFRTTSATSQRIEINGSDICADYLHIFNHNLTGNAIIYLQGTNDNDWSSPEYSEMVTPSNGVIFHDLTIDTPVSWSGTPFGSSPFGSSPFGITKSVDKYCFDNWSLLITDPNLSDIQIGFISLGEYVQGPLMAPNQDLTEISASTKSMSESGQIYGNQRYQYISPNIKFPFTTKENREDLLKVWEANADTIPFVLLIWAEDFSYEDSIYCVIDQKSLKFTKRGGNTPFPFSINIKFKEAR